MIENHIGAIIKVSKLYETKAWGVEDQPDFLNQALICRTALTPMKILENIHLIENKMGRKRDEKWGPRILDIDIILFGNEIVKTEVLQIPHPEMTNRNFVLVPIMEICSEKIHPELQVTIQELMNDCQDSLEVKVVQDQD